MDKEYVILNHIHKDGKTTQRKLAKDAGISVGAVNLLLKNMVRKGLVKIERLNAKTLRYILTPKGIQEKVRLTYDYTKLSYRRITLISEGVKAIVEDEVQVKDRAKEIIIFGPRDEVCEIIKMGLSKMGMSFKCFKDQSKLENYIDFRKDGGIIFAWRAQEEVFLKARGFHVVNVLDRVEF